MAAVLSLNANNTQQRILSHFSFFSRCLLKLVINMPHFAVCMFCKRYLKWSKELEGPAGAH